VHGQVAAPTCDITDYRLSQKIFSGEMYPTICVELAAVTSLVFVWRKSTHLWRRYAKNDFYIFVPSDLDLKFAPIVTLVQRYVSTKLEVSTRLKSCIDKIGGMGQMDREMDRLHST